MKEGNIASNIVIKNNSRLCGGSLASHNVMKSSKIGGSLASVNVSNKVRKCGGSLASHNVMKSSKIGGGRKKKRSSKSKRKRTGKKRKSNKKKSSKSSKKKKSTKKKRISKRKMKGGDGDTEINVTIKKDNKIDNYLLLFFEKLAEKAYLWSYTDNLHLDTDNLKNIIIICTIDDNKYTITINNDLIITEILEITKIQKTSKTLKSITELSFNLKITINKDSRV